MAPPKFIKWMGRKHPALSKWDLEDLVLKRVKSKRFIFCAVALLHCAAYAVRDETSHWVDSKDEGMILQAIK